MLCIFVNATIFKMKSHSHFLVKIKVLVLLIKSEIIHDYRGVMTTMLEGTSAYIYCAFNRVNRNRSFRSSIALPSNKEDILYSAVLYCKTTHTYYYRAVYNNLPASVNLALSSSTVAIDSSWGA